MRFRCAPLAFALCSSALLCLAEMPGRGCPPGVDCNSAGALHVVNDVPKPAVGGRKMLTSAGLSEALATLRGARGLLQLQEEDGGSAAARPGGLVVSPEVYGRGLQYLQTQVLPLGWKLNAVQKWDAYGHGVKTLAGQAAKQGLPVSVLTNEEAAAALASAKAEGINKPRIWRIMPADGPAKNPTIVEAVRQGLGVEELMSPLNQKDILDAAAATNTTILVHIYLYDHYGEPFGYNFSTSQQLQDFVQSLDPKLVKVQGLMIHNGGVQSKEAAEQRVARFNSVVCPVAQNLSAAQPIELHFASSIDVEFFMPEQNQRMIAPTPLCQGPNITWYTRIGSLTYGSDPDDNAMLQGGVSPVMTWYAPITYITNATADDGTARKVAVVKVNPHRYPSPDWWPGIQAYIPGDGPDEDGDGTDGSNSNSTRTEQKNGTAGYQPDSYVYIGDEQYRLASIPADSSTLLVDVSQANDTVKAGDRVCILCDKHPLEALAKEVGADGYNVALCLSGEEPVVGTEEDTPKCQPLKSVPKAQG